MNHPILPWLHQEQNFPSVDQAWGAESSASGLLCAGGDLSVSSLKNAYQRGIFPWFSYGQPILWWSPDPRMILVPDDFRVHPSLQKTLRKFIRSEQSEIRIDTAFDAVIRNCANCQRHGQQGTWIVPDMIQAYSQFHQAGFAHSVETWVKGDLVGGLYFIAIGHAVFGESMFHRTTDASKIALAALVCLCKFHKISQIDCQQNTNHLASLGAREVQRNIFVQNVNQLIKKPAPDWKFSSSHWNVISFLNSVVT